MAVPTTADVKALTAALAAPFDPGQVRFRAGAIDGNKALALAYVDARTIQDRLDAVLGVEGWQDNYLIQPSGAVVCHLRLRLGDEWVTKMDVGGPGEQSANGDRLKAAFSDALKRAAVKFGIGRYLYRLPAQWLDFDPVRRKFVQTPTLTGSTQAPAKALPSRLPADGAELHRRLHAHDARLAAEGRCAAGSLLRFVVEAGAREGYGTDLTAWHGPAIVLAAKQASLFEKLHRVEPPARQGKAA